MERIFLCNEIWFDCLPFLSRAKVGFEFALVSDRFDGLADAHLNSRKRPWKLGRLWIKQKQGDTVIVKNYRTKNEEHLPLPDGPLPENVIGFERITISYADQKIIDFLRRIRRLFQPKNNGNDNDGIGLEFYIYSDQVCSCDIFFDSIWPLINPFSITNLYFPWDFDEFRRRISPTFLLNLANVRMLVTSFYDLFENGENGQLLWQWLYTPREDGKPKLLTNYYYGQSLQTVEQVKTEFLSAQNAVSFIIAFYVYRYDDSDLFVPFELDNWHTGERLKFRNVKNIDDYEYWLLERGPIGGRDAVKWAKWEREAMGMEKQHNVLNIDFGDDNIGFLSPH